MRLAALAPWREGGRDWWRGRSPREQVLLGVLAALALAALLLMTVVRPLGAVRARAAADLRTADSLALRLRQGRPAAARPLQGPPAVLLSQAAAAAGLTVQRLDSENGRLRVAFADASYDAVLRWVSAVERTTTLRVAEARIDRATGAAGGVSASFLMAP